MDDYAPLRFRFEDICRELKILSELTRGFFDSKADDIFRRLETVIRQYQISRSKIDLRWEVVENQPLRTVETNRFEPGRRHGGLDVVGEVTWCWTIRNVQVKRGDPKEFEITGNASVKLRIHRKNDNRSEGIAMWRIESGAADAPGCFFHTQILAEAEIPPFPKSLTIPRLPTLFVTPMAAIEFFLGELFQDDWAEHVAGDRGDLLFWNKVQQQRLRDLLKWKQKQIDKCQGSPWLALKKAKPRQSDGLFVAENS